MMSRRELLKALAVGLPSFSMNPCLEPRNPLQELADHAARIICDKVRESEVFSQFDFRTECVDNYRKFAAAFQVADTESFDEVCEQRFRWVANGFKSCVEQNEGRTLVVRGSTRLSKSTTSWSTLGVCDNFPVRFTVAMNLRTWATMIHCHLNYTVI